MSNLNGNNWLIPEYNEWIRIGSPLSMTVERLDLTGSEISSLSEYIANLVNLKYLYLNYTNLTNIPDGIGNLYNLEELYLKGNNITTLPNTIGNLKNLGIIDLDNNINLVDLPEQTSNIINYKSGFNVDELIDGGFTIPQVINGGFSVSELKDGSITADQLKSNGFSLSELRSSFANEELQGIFTVSQLLVYDLKLGGSTATELKVAGFSALEIKVAGFSALELKVAGFSPKTLKDVGYSTTDMRNANFTINDLKHLGYSYTEIKQAGFSDLELYFLQTYYLDSFEVNTTPIDSTFSRVDTTPLFGDATALISVPYSVIKTMFKFRPSTNGTNNTHFKFVKPSGWTTVYDPANAIVIEGSMSETTEDITIIDNNSNVLHTNSIKFDYVKYIAQQLFYNWRLYALFNNSNEVAESISNNTSGINPNGELYKRFEFLNNLGTLDNSSSINNPSRSILQQILKNDIGRFDTLELDSDGWFNVPIHVGEYIAWNIIINPSSSQADMINRDMINPRKYLVKMLITNN
jgi:hypothetical protein